MDKSREQFEAWLNTQFNPILRREESGEYTSVYVHVRWQAWQASRKELAIDCLEFDTFSPND